VAVAIHRRGGRWRKTWIASLRSHDGVGRGALLSHGGGGPFRYREPARTGMAIQLLGSGMPEIPRLRMNRVPKILDAD